MALGLLTLLGLVIYLVVSGIRQKNVAKAVWPVVIFCSCLGLVYFAMSCAIMD
ncbi:putative membrane protein [Lactobacillus delbrueckii subsp. lactis CRL581]|nr:putative membrane protein [Lactobacillus delbrueckii subsp. lactis CRL581]